MRARDTTRAWRIAGWRAANTTLDVVFYDVSSLTSEERAALSAHATPEGSVLLVEPGGTGQRLRVLAPRDFVHEQAAAGAERVDAIVVAGVGSSALGTAALARNVADHRGRPVAGIVSGLGMADVITEALGGWFVLGASNTVRYGLARLFDAWELRDHVRDPESHRAMKTHFADAGIDTEAFIYGSPDSTTLLYLLSELGPRIELLVGHSKGNYSIENALGGWLDAARRTGKPVSTGLCVVTLGAVIRFPPEFTNVHQFIGGIDVFGLMNSRATVERVRVPGAWHSVNTRMPGHLSVQTALRSLDAG